jgi:hypothetical protein
MLVVLSDIHFQEDTFSRDRNVDPRALRLFFEQIGRTAEAKGATELLVVFNGDVFDHIRNARWLEQDEDGLTVRPYEDHDPARGQTLAPKTDDRAWEIHQAIEADPRVRESIQLIEAMARGDDDIFPKTLQPRFLYIPGTSDRLANLSARINRRIRHIFNSKPPQEGKDLEVFPNQLLFAAGLPEGYPRAEDELDMEPGSLDYAALVQHGHEYDWLSCEFNQDENLLGRSLTPEDSRLYALSPLSDWIAIDLVCALAHSFLEECGGEEEELIPFNRDIYQCLLEAQDVRPQLRVLQYLMWRLEGERWLPIRHIVRRLLKDARNHYHLEKWLTRHDQRWVPDRADKIQAALATLGRLGEAIPDSMLARIAQRASARTGPDEPPVELVRKDPIWECDEIHHLCVGHFHDGVAHTLSVVDGHPKVVVGTGTWRRRHELCLDEISHIALRSMGYAIFYRPEEQPGSRAHRMEHWRGKTITQRPDTSGESRNADEPGERRASKPAEEEPA